MKGCVYSVGVVKRLILTIGVCLLIGRAAWGDINLNVLAVNGTKERREKEIRFDLPPDVTAQDVLETDGLNLDYDVTKGVYFVSGKVSLDPKETKTYKVRIRDIWRIDEEKVRQIKEQIDRQVEVLKGTKYYSNALKKKEFVLGRIDSIEQQQKEVANNIEKRISYFRSYADELDQIRQQAFSVEYWRQSLPSVESGQTIQFVIELSNPSQKEVLKVSRKYYLPREVKPEHVVDNQGFDIRYDPVKQQPYLFKEEELSPGEKKRYSVRILDIWKIPSEKIQALKDRARKAYKLLKPTRYEATARDLAVNIKNALKQIEVSQARELPINEHISAFRLNEKRFKRAKRDVETMEDLLAVVREDLERSKLKNVLRKVKSLRSVADIADAFLKKFSMNTVWMIIFIILGFVGGFTIIHFIFWGKQSRFKDVERGQSSSEGDPKEPDREASEETS